MKYKLPIITIVVVVLLFVGLLIILNQSSTDTKKQEITFSYDKKSTNPGVTIDNYSTYAAQLNTADLATRLPAEVYARIVANSTTTPPKSITSTIRDGSFTQIPTAQADIPYFEFMIDIPSVKQSYKVTFQGGDAYDRKILYVICPNADELKYPAFACKDSE